MKLIEENYAYGDDGLEQVGYYEEKRIADLLVGHSVAKVNVDHLVLDDGTLLRIIPNDGGCCCGSGDYELTELHEVPNIITNVEFVKNGLEQYGDFSGAYRVFVYAANERINLFSVEGDDGNGYYGTGYHILVRKPEPPQPELLLGVDDDEEAGDVRFYMVEATAGGWDNFYCAVVCANSREEACDIVRKECGSWSLETPGSWFPIHRDAELVAVPIPPKVGPVLGYGVAG